MKTVLSIVIMAAVTYVIRAVPLVFFRKEVKSERIQSFLYYMPYAVLGAMTFPAVFYSTGSVLSASLGVAAALLAAFLELGLVTSAAAAAIIVFITELIF